MTAGSKAESTLDCEPGCPCPRAAWYELTLAVAGAVRVRTGTIQRAVHSVACPSRLAKSPGPAAAVFIIPKELLSPPRRRSRAATRAWAPGGPRVAGKPGPSRCCRPRPQCVRSYVVCLRRAAPTGTNSKRGKAQPFEGH
jgi:hypothetical protein